MYRKDRCIIGLGGKKRSGKSTAADFLVQNGNFIELSFAKPLKEACKILFDLKDEQVYGEKKDFLDTKLGVTPRKILQVFGTEICQFAIHKHLPNLRIKKRNLFCWLMKQKILSNMEYDIVISDVRFPHEADLIHELGGNVVKLIRIDNPYDGKDDHASENSLDNIEFDKVFKLDSVSTLKYKIAQYIGEIRLQFL